MRANVLSTPTFRYLGGNFIDVEFEQLSPKPWSDIDNEDSIAELNEVFTDKKVAVITDNDRDYARNVQSKYSYYQQFQNMNCQ